MNELLIDGTELLQRTLESTAKILVHEGGSGSSKTVSCVQALEGWSFDYQQDTFSVVRKTLPALKRGALKDFRESLERDGAADLFVENKTELTFTNRQTGTAIEFFSLDNPQKARGPRRRILYCDEANELTEEDFRQLSMRTRGRIILSYNPSMQSHWIYDKVLTRPDCERIHSTYRDNSFLTPENIREIEIDVPVWQLPDGRTITDWNLSHDGTGVLIGGDPYRWAVFGLGRRGSVGEAVYRAVYECSELPEGDDEVYGLDFGYNDPMVLERVKRRDGEPRPRLYADELLHESYVTTDDLIRRLPSLGVKKTAPIYADGSRPEAIEEVKRAGYNIKAADKGPGSIKTGIDFVKRHDLYFTRRSAKTKREHQDYRYQKKPDGTVLEIPVDKDNHGPDAVRYAAFSHWSPIKTPPRGTRAFR